MSVVEYVAYFWCIRVYIFDKTPQKYLLICIHTIIFNIYIYVYTYVKTENNVKKIYIYLYYLFFIFVFL